MTIVIANNSPRVSYTVAEGATQTSFAVSFEFFADADLNFIVDGTTKTLTTHYTVSGGDGSTGTITTTSGNSVTGITGNSTVVITRSIALERTTDFPAQGSFQISSLNTELDRFTAIAADLNDKANRSLQLTDYDTAVSLTLPAVDTRKGKVLAFNASTGAVEAGPSTSDVQTVSANAASVALLGTSDAVADMNALSATAVLADMDLLGTAAVVEDMGLLATSAVIEDMGLLATSAVIEDMGLLATSANVTAMGVLGTSANVTAMAALSDSAVLADMALLGTSAVIADMALLATSDVISDLNTLATSDIVTDLNLLATSDIVSDMNALATSDIISDMNALATSDIISDLNALATSDIISDMNTLSASAVIADMASLAGSGANPNITSVTASGTIQFGSLSDGTITITDIADEDNMSSNSAVKLATQQSIKAYADSVVDLRALKSNNLSDLANAGTARSNLGLGTAAVLATGISNTNVLIANAAVSDNDFLKIDGTSVEGRTATEVISDLSLDTVKKEGKESIYIPATAMYPSTTNGCASLAQVETTALRPDLMALDFATGADEFAQFSIAFPKSWNEGTVTFQPYWTVTGTNTGTVAWGLSGIAVSSDDSINTAFGTTVVCTALAHSGTSNDLMMSVESGAVTIAGSPAAEDMCFFQVTRDVSADNQSGDARLLGIKVFFTTDAANDA